VDGRYRVVEWDRATKTTRVVLAGTGDYRHPAYSSSGRWLFVSQNESGQWDIGRLWRATGRKEVLTASPANDFTPAVSPDERTLYFASDRKRGYRFSAIYWMPLR
jgi:Tol biopolymer transport system component